MRTNVIITNHIAQVSIKKSKQDLDAVKRLKTCRHIQKRRNPIRLKHSTTRCVTGARRQSNSINGFNGFETEKTRNTRQHGWKRLQLTNITDSKTGENSSNN